MPYDPERHGPKRVVGPGFRERVIDVVKRVPAGFVTTYGDVAAALGSRQVARHVGFALAALPSGRGGVPWHRVVGSAGRISLVDAREQVIRLAEEGVEVDATGRLPRFEAVRWPAEFLRGVGSGGRDP